jgi:hypothetical protein
MLKWLLLVFNMLFGNILASGLLVENSYKIIEKSGDNVLYIRRKLFESTTIRIWTWKVE